MLKLEGLVDSDAASCGLADGDSRASWAASEAEGGEGMAAALASLRSALRRIQIWRCARAEEHEIRSVARNDLIRSSFDKPLVDV